MDVQRKQIDSFTLTVKKASREDTSGPWTTWTCERFSFGVVATISGEIPNEQVEKARIDIKTVRPSKWNFDQGKATALSGDTALILPAPFLPLDTAARFGVYPQPGGSPADDNEQVASYETSDGKYLMCIAIKYHGDNCRSIASNAVACLLEATLTPKRQQDPRQQRAAPTATKEPENKKSNRNSVARTPAETPYEVCSALADGFDLSFLALFGALVITLRLSNSMSVLFDKAGWESSWLSQNCRKCSSRKEVQLPGFFTATKRLLEQMACQLQTEATSNFLRAYTMTMAECLLLRKSKLSPIVFPLDVAPTSVFASCFPDRLAWVVDVMKYLTHVEIFSIVGPFSSDPDDVRERLLAMLFDVSFWTGAATSRLTEQADNKDSRPNLFYAVLDQYNGHGAPWQAKSWEERMLEQLPAPAEMKRALVFFGTSHKIIFEGLLRPMLEIMRNGRVPFGKPFEAREQWLKRLIRCLQILRATAEESSNMSLRRWVHTLETDAMSAVLPGNSRCVFLCTVGQSVFIGLSTKGCADLANLDSMLSKWCTQDGTAPETQDDFSGGFRPDEMVRAMRNPGTQLWSKPIATKYLWFQQAVLKCSATPSIKGLNWMWSVDDIAKCICSVNFVYCAKQGIDVPRRGVRNDPPASGRCERVNDPAQTPRLPATPLEMVDALRKDVRTVPWLQDGGDFDSDLSRPLDLVEALLRPAKFLYPHSLSGRLDWITAFKAVGSSCKFALADVEACACKPEFVCGTGAGARMTRSQLSMLDERVRDWLQSIGYNFLYTDKFLPLIDDAREKLRVHFTPKAPGSASAEDAGLAASLGSTNERLDRLERTVAEKMDNLTNVFEKVLAQQAMLCELFAAQQKGDQGTWKGAVVPSLNLKNVPGTPTIHPPMKFDIATPGRANSACGNDDDEACKSASDSSEAVLLSDGGLQIEEIQFDALEGENEKTAVASTDEGSTRQHADSVVNAAPSALSSARSAPASTTLMALSMRTPTKKIKMPAVASAPASKNTGVTRPAIVASALLDPSEKSDADEYEAAVSKAESAKNEASPDGEQNGVAFNAEDEDDADDVEEDADEEDSSLDSSRLPLRSYRSYQYLSTPDSVRYSVNSEHEGMRTIHLKGFNKPVLRCEMEYVVNKVVQALFQARGLAATSPYLWVEKNGEILSEDQEQSNFIVNPAGDTSTAVVANERAAEMKNVGGLQTQGTSTFTNISSSCCTGISTRQATTKVVQWKTLRIGNESEHVDLKIEFVFEFGEKDAFCCCVVAPDIATKNQIEVKFFPDTSGSARKVEIDILDLFRDCSAKVEVAAGETTEDGALLISLRDEVLAAAKAKRQGQQQQVPQQCQSPALNYSGEKVIFTAKRNKDLVQKIFQVVFRALRGEDKAQRRAEFLGSFFQELWCRNFLAGAGDDTEKEKKLDAMELVFCRSRLQTVTLEFDNVADDFPSKMAYSLPNLKLANDIM
ncbi:unnamed protein product [Amoebophrya sp. A120]|nr:unnamed protein product [Amoebophrya sp. A120]|eukprot:GSA120T00013760001.1